MQQEMPTTSSAAASTSVVHHREARLADVRVLARLPHVGEAGGDSVERMFRYLSGEHHPQQALLPRVMYMAERGGSAIGYIAGHLSRRYDCQGELQWIYVVSANRRTGVASQLIRRLAEWFVLNDAHRICVDVGDDNARGFYARHGAVDLNKHWMVWNDIANVLETHDSP
jgi:GNAT superfamily N-acetyltransferase